MSAKPRMAFVGVECTGKSTLAEKFAKHYSGVVIPEFARTYLEVNGPNYEFETLELIARGQLAREEKARKNHVDRVLCFDTTLHVIKIWSEEVYSKVSPWIEDRLKELHYDLVVIPKPDIPWVFDPLRETPDPKQRERLFQRYLQLIDSTGLNYCVIGGSFSERDAALHEEMKKRFPNLAVNP